MTNKIQIGGIYVYVFLYVYLSEKTVFYYSQK